MTEHNKPNLSSFIPADIWYRCPLKKENIADILENIGCRLATAQHDREVLLLTVAKSLDFAYPNILYLRRLLPKSAAKKYVEALNKFLAASALADVWDFRDPPPEVPMDWLKANREWIKARVGSDAARGRPGNIGDDDFFRIMLAVYNLAFGRKPSPNPTGPTFRFLRAICDALGQAIQQPKWPHIPDATLIAGIRQHRGEIERDMVAAIFSLCRDAVGDPVAKIH